MQSTSAADPLVGRTLGEFVVREKIGEGGFGAVYRAEQPALQREAVIKVLHKQLLGSDIGVKRFLLEARMASRLDHPYAAHVYAFGAEPDGLLWIAMELVRGSGLDRLLSAQGAMPLERLVPLLERICEVVHTAHEQGIVHRDLKPANVLVLARAGRYLPKLLDFGIAKAVHAVDEGKPAVPVAEPVTPPEGTGADLGSEATLEAASGPPSPLPRAATPIPLPTGTESITRTGAMMGSPRYMAPEQWTDPASADAATDVYALGVLAYECLVGKPPFAGRSLQELARAHARAAVPALPESLPQALHAVLTRAMAKRKQERYRSAIELATAFREASGLAGERPTLPELEAAARAAAIADLPQPIAEAVSALSAARSAHQARDAAAEVVHTMVRWLGLLALAARSRVGAGQGDPAAVVEALRALRRRQLTDQEWLDLARALCQPFAEMRDAHPLPELCALLTGGDGRSLAALEGLVASPLAAARGLSEEQVRELLERRLPELARALREIAFLGDYPLVVPRQALVESWMGVRRPRRAALSTQGAPLEQRRPALVDGDGRPVLSLWPLVQAEPPAPGAPEELFLFDGGGRRGARYLALPAPFERHDDGVWSWLGATLAESADQQDGAGEAARAPYRGLEAFTAADAGSYFGREREVDAFANRLRVQPMLAVVGASGAGKSSFVHAGVIPALPEGWRALGLRPGATPLAALQARLAGLGVDVDRARPEALAEALAAEVAARGPLVLVVDQAEELFTLCGDAEERLAAARALAAAAGAGGELSRVVLTLRDDFLLRLEQLEPLRERLAGGLTLLATPARDDLRRILVEPARRAGYELEDAQLIEEMLDAVADQPGALALLSFTAAQLWHLRDRHFKQLPRRAYQAIGGVAGALATHAESVLTGMTHDEQRLTREAFRQLLNADGTRAVLRRHELLEVLGGDARAERVVERLVGARLLSASEGEGGEERIEVVHEALVSAWPRLAGWRREEAEGARLRDQLRAAARQWDERGRPRGLLWRDEALAEYSIWRARFPGALTAAETAFGEASLRDAARGRWLRRGVLAAVFVMLGVFLALQITANRKTAAARALAEEKATESQQNLRDSYVEQGRTALLAGRHGEALAYLAQAQAMGAGDAAVRFMLARAAEPFTPLEHTLRGEGRVWTASFSHDGRLVLTTDDTGATLWSPADGRALRRLAGHTDKVWRAAFMRDDAELLTASHDGSVRRWRVSDGAELAVLRGHDSPILALDVDREGARFATGDVAGRVCVWSIDSASPRCFDAGTARGSVHDLRFDRDGGKLALAHDDGTAAVIDAATGAELAAVATGDTVTAIRFDPSGERVVAASWSGTATLFDASSGARITRLTGHGDKLESAGFSPDGERLLTVGRDGTARLWSRDGVELFVLRGHRGAVTAASFSPDGKLLVTVADLSAVVWEVESGRRIAVLEGHSAVLAGAQFSPDGRRLVTASWDGTAKVWAVRDFHGDSVAAGDERSCWPIIGGARGGSYAAVVCGGHTRVIDLARGVLVVDLPAGSAAAVAPDGKAAAVIADGEVRVFSLPDGRRLDARPVDKAVAAVFAANGTLAVLGEQGVVLRDAAGAWSTVDGASTRAGAFTPDSERLLLARATGRLDLFDLRTHAVVGGVDRSTLTEAIVVAADGSHAVCLGSPEQRSAPRLLRLSPDGVADGFELAGHDQVVWAAHFDASGERLVTAGGDSVAIVWEVATGRRLATLSGSRQFLLAAEFDPSGELVVTTGGDGALRFWSAGDGKLLWELEAERDFVVDAAYAGGERVTTVGVRGNLRVWKIGVEHVDPAGLLCRSPFNFDRESATVMLASPGCP